MRYIEISSEHPKMVDCFFAFSNKQLKEGIDKFNLEIENIVCYPGGLYGTKDGITKFLSFYDNQSERIKAECNPQEVYDYEFNNHECGYTNDDTEAIKIVVSYFGEEAARLVKRKNGYVKIDDLFNEA